MGILQDDRTIVELWICGEGGERWTVGRQSVGSIVAYGEPGEFCLVPWFEVRHDNGVVMVRLNGNAVAGIAYAPCYVNEAKERP